jgi:peptide/nickel transport system permease protein
MRRLDLGLVVALAAFAVIFGLAVFGARIAPYEPFYIVLDLGKQSPPYAPGGPFPLGTDTSARDLWSLILYGARVTLTIAAAAGLGRVLLGLVLAAFGSQSAPVRLILDGVSEVASALPVTLVAVLAVLALAGPDARALPFVAAMVLTGWPGPYRVARAELKRLATAPFTESAQALGLRVRAILMRHHIPHLMPLLAISVSQQMTASLVALAELGVFAIFIGRIRSIGIGTTPISDIPEWGGLLANARSVENLYTTRWVFLVPGVAIAAAAILVSVIGIGVANRYRRRDVLADLRSPAAGLIAAVVVACVALAAVLPQRYPQAHERASAVRGGVIRGADLASALTEGGFSAIGSGVVQTSSTALRQSGPATIVARGSDTITLTDGPDATSDAQAVLYSQSGGGVVDAPLVFVGWGISPADYPAVEQSAFAPPSFGKVIENWADDYAAVDVRGKTVLLLKLESVPSARFRIAVPDVATIVGNALKRGAAAVLYVDPMKGRYAAVPSNFGVQVDPYRRLGQVDPTQHRVGPPVFVLSLAAGDRLLAPVGLSATAIYRSSERGISSATDVPLRAHIELPVDLLTTTSRSLVAERATSEADRHRVIIWALSPDPPDGAPDALDAVAAFARSLHGSRDVAVTIVVFDPAGDTALNAGAVRAALGDRVADLILVVSDLRGDRLQFLTQTPEFVPVADGYAELMQISYQPTLSMAGDSAWTWPGVSAYAAARTIWVRGAGNSNEETDLRSDAAAFLAYAFARYELGAPEIRR